MRLFTILGVGPERYLVSIILPVAAAYVDWLCMRGQAYQKTTVTLETIERFYLKSAR
jgi:hypothetical protein